MKQSEDSITQVPRGTTECPLCHSPQIVTVYREVYDHAASMERFSIRSCSNCCVLFTHPAPSDQAKYYDSKDYISHSENQRGLVNTLYHYIKKINLNYKFRVARRHTLGIKWADYGAGAGSFCSYAKQKNIDITAYEPNSFARENCKKKGLKVFDTNTFNQTNIIYDCITLWHVLEHVTNPIETIGQLKAKLHATGTLIIALPNHDSYDCKYYKRYWAAWDVPRHLWHLNEDAMHQLAENTDLKIVKTYPLYFDSFYVAALSEKYKKGFLPFALLIGVISNLHALLRIKPYSSMVYILKKAHT